jgi:hypothetical protein
MVEVVRYGAEDEPPTAPVIVVLEEGLETGTAGEETTGGELTAGAELVGEDTCIEPVGEDTCIELVGEETGIELTLEDDTDMADTTGVELLIGAGGD